MNLIHTGTGILNNVFLETRYIFWFSPDRHNACNNFILILVLIVYFMFLFSFLLWQAAEKLRALPDVHYKLKDKPVNNSDQWKKPKICFSPHDDVDWRVSLVHGKTIQLQYSRCTINNLVIVFTTRNVY